MTATTDTRGRWSSLVLAIVVVTSVAAVGTGVATSVDDGNASTEAGETSHLRVVHAAPDAPNVDVYLDNETALSNVSFGNASDYLEIEPGERRVTITAAGNRSAVVFDAMLPVEAGVSYSAIAQGELSPDSETPFVVGVLVDDATTPGPDESLVRVLHLSPDAPAVDVTVAGTDVVLADNVTFESVTNYTAVPAGNYTVEVRVGTATNDGDVVAAYNVSLEGGAAYTAIAIGYLSPETAPGDAPFDLLVLEDRTVAEVTETTTAEATTEAPPIPANETTTQEEETTAPVNETATTEAPTTTPANETTTPMNETTTQEHETTTPMNETTTPANETTTPANETTEGY